MSEQNQPDAADSGDSPTEGTDEIPSPRGDAEEPATPAAAMQQAPPQGLSLPVRPRIEWRSYSGIFILVWLLALAWMASLVLSGPISTTTFPRLLAAKAAMAIGTVLALAFIVPLALLDDSSHHTRAWWVAWLWPPVMGLMLVADAIAIGAVATRLAPLLPLLKSH